MAIQPGAKNPHIKRNHQPNKNQNQRKPQNIRIFKMFENLQLRDLGLFLSIK